MIEQPTLPTWGPSLFEAVLAGHLFELRGVDVFFDGEIHGRPWWSVDPVQPAEPRPSPEPAPEPAPDGEFEVDERFPQLGLLRGLLAAGADRLAAARAAQLEQRRAAGVQVRQLAAFAGLRPAGRLDWPDGEVGAAAAASRAARPVPLTAVSEWAVDEVMLALGLSAPEATNLLAESIVLDQRLPATVDALEAGRISWRQAQAMAELVGPVKDEVRADVEARLLARAEGKTVPQLRAAARRAVLKADAAAHTRRLAAAIRDRSVRAHPGRDGMGTLAATMPVPLLEACRAALRAYAQECATPGDARTLDQRMLDCLADLILRPGQGDLPPVQVQLTIVATAATMAGGDEPGEINGQLVSALEIRELAYALGLLPRPQPAEPPAADGDATDGDATNDVATDDDATDGDATDGDATDDVATDGDATYGDASDGARGDDRDDAAAGAGAGSGAGAGDDAAAGEERGTGPAAMGIAAEGLGPLLALRGIAGTALAELPHIAVVDEISGQLLALTNATEIRRAATCGHRRCRTGVRPCTHPPAGPGLGPPPPTDGYRPCDPLARFVRARDRRCRFPGCRAAAIRCDLDHNRPWPHGTTSADNLCCLCRHHHRLSHQAPGWTMTRLPDGGLQWTTPGGHTVTTHPIGYGTDDDLPPPRPHEADPATVSTPVGTLEYLRNWSPPPPPDPNEEPAPF